MLTLHRYKTLTKAENTGHRNKVFPGEKKLLKVTELTKPYPILHGF